VKKGGRFWVRKEAWWILVDEKRGQLKRGVKVSFDSGRGGKK